MRIDQLKPGAEVVLLFDGYRIAYTEDAVFLGITGTGEERRAQFKCGEDEWEAYRYKRRWAYGADADPLRLLGVK